MVSLPVKALFIPGELIIVLFVVLFVALILFWVDMRLSSAALLRRFERELAREKLNAAMIRMAEDRRQKIEKEGCGSPALRRAGKLAAQDARKETTVCEERGDE